MGSFDYTCECRRKKRPTCNHVGQQGNDAEVVIEVPFKNGMLTHLVGYYEGYGYVTIDLGSKEYYFYLTENQELFKDWLERKDEEERSRCFVATKIWTYREEASDEENSDCDGDHKAPAKRECFNGTVGAFTQSVMESCKRADENLGLTSDNDKYLIEIKHNDKKK